MVADDFMSPIFTGRETAGHGANPCLGVRFSARFSQQKPSRKQALAGADERAQNHESPATRGFLVGDTGLETTPAGAAAAPRAREVPVGDAGCSQRASGWYSS